MNQQTRIRHALRPSPVPALLVLLLPLAAACGGSRSEADLLGETDSVDPLTRSLFNTPPEPLAEEAIDLAVLGYDFGSPDAALRIMELSDFGCGYCRKFHEETFPVLQEEYMDAGTVLWKYIPVVTGMFPHGELAALAGECAGEQNAFEGMMEQLFRDQPAWKSSSDALPLLFGYAAQLGLNTDQFRSCLEEERPGERLATGKRLARMLGLRGTPSFVINGYPVQGALPTQLFREILANELAVAEQAAAGER